MKEVCMCPTVSHLLELGLIPAGFLAFVFESKIHPGNSLLLQFDYLKISAINRSSEDCFCMQP